MRPANLQSSAIVSREGKISLPVLQRRVAGIEPGTAVSVRTDGKRIIIQSIDSLLDEIQEDAQRMLASTGDSVDAFLRDKREDAAREMAKF